MKFIMDNIGNIIVGVCALIVLCGSSNNTASEID